MAIFSSVFETGMSGIVPDDASFPGAALSSVRYFWLNMGLV
jgi:hypothetical protein